MTYLWFAQTPTVPPQRDFHSAVAIGEDMYVFGGRSDEAAPHYTGRDTYPWRMYKFNTRSRTWCFVGRSVSPANPRGRRSSSACELWSEWKGCGQKLLPLRHWISLNRNRLIGESLLVIFKLPILISKSSLTFQSNIYLAKICMLINLFFNVYKCILHCS
jgi:hypothetical protein